MISRQMRKRWQHKKTMIHSDRSSRAVTFKSTKCRRWRLRHDLKNDVEKCCKIPQQPSLPINLVLRVSTDISEIYDWVATVSFPFRWNYITPRENEFCHWSSFCCHQLPASCVCSWSHVITLKWFIAMLNGYFDKFFSLPVSRHNARHFSFDHAHNWPPINFCSFAWHFVLFDGESN